ncbi:TonB-dependent receptor [Methylobacillus glycogenes]|uniref:TonB-dependent receptor n=1 Tax=Methylobacillus glycogenes TaxID=406 RepID=UPI0005636F9B|nr:TonB-dependent receptor [Methylobacillus glycogenes]
MKRIPMRTRKIGTAVQCALVLLYGHVALAEDTEAEPSDLGSVVVVSDKEVRDNYLGDTKVESTPGSRATLTKFQLEKLAGIGSVYDSLKFLPGVQSQGGNSYGAGGAGFTVRGFSGGQIGIVRDGLPLNDPLFQLAVGSVIGDPEDYESISLIYGSSSISLPSVTASGGSIILKTVAPTKEPGVMLKQSFGNYDVQKTYTRINFGEHNGFSGWISASDSRYDNWQAGRLRAQTKRFGANLQYQWDENSINFIISTQEMENWSTQPKTKAQYDAQPYKSGYPLTAFSTYRGTNGVADSVNPTASQYLYSTSFHVQNYMVNSHFKLSDKVDLYIDPYFQRIRGGTSSSGAVVLSEVGLGTDLNRDGDQIDTGVPFALQMLPAQYRPGISAKLDWQLSDSNKLQLGGWYERIHSRQTFSYVPIKANGKPFTNNGESNIAVDGRGNAVYRSDQRTDMPTFKLWAEDVWSVNEQLKLTTALAYHQTKVEAHNIGQVLSGTSINYNNPGYERDKTYDRFLPAFSLDYQADQNNQLYYSVSSNLRVPAAASLYTTANSSQKAETTINQEIGWRYRDSKISTSAALFYDNFKNRQVSYQTPQFVTAYYNAGKVETKGLELALNGLLPHSFNYSASYAYTLATQQEDFVVEGGNGTGPAALDTKGKQLFNTPKHLASIGLGYDDGSFYSDIRAYYKSSLYGDLTNKEKVEGATTVNLALGYRVNNISRYFKNAVFSLNVNNLFDKEYLQGVSAGTLSSGLNDGRVRGTPTYLLAEPRTIVGSVQFNF